MVLNLIDRVCKQLFSGQSFEWVDLKKAINAFMDYGLAKDEAKDILDFLAKYFLEVDECECKARPIESFRRLYTSD